MERSLEVRVDTGRRAVLSQVDLLQENLGKVKSEWKPDNSRVTKIDHAISRNLETQIKELYPLDHYCSEESQDTGTPIRLENRFSWIADPVDGTNNYALGVANCAISLGLLDEGEPVYGFLYDLSRRLLVEGGPGAGLLEDGNKVKALQEEPMVNRSIVGMHFPLPAERLEQLMPIIQTQRLRSLGSGALNLLHAASGRIDGAIDFKVKVWDIAAGVAFAKATGRSIHFPEGPPFPLKEFSVDAPLTPYYCGTESFCSEATRLLIS
jgi:myo-inositol-1(or 4)-monophosphatase